MDPVTGLTITLAERIAQLGLLATIAVLLGIVVWKFWGVLEKRWAELTSAWAARIEDNNVLQQLVQTMTAALQALTVQIDKRSAMTETLAEGQRGIVTGFENYNRELARLRDRMDVSDSVCERCRDEVLRRIEEVESIVRRIDDKTR